MSWCGKPSKEITLFFLDPTLILALTRKHRMTLHHNLKMEEGGGGGKKRKQLLIQLVDTGISHFGWVGVSLGNMVMGFREMES